MALDTTARTWHGVVTERGWVGGGVEQCPCLYRFIDFEDQVLSGLAPAAHVKKGLSGSQARNGAFRSEGLEWLVAGEHGLSRGHLDRSLLCRCRESFSIRSIR